MGTWIFLILCLVFLSLSDSCEIKINQKSLINAEPILLNKTANGEKLLLGNLNQTQQNYIYIARLKGSSYQMGKAYGELFEIQLKQNIKNFYDYYLKIVANFLVKKHIPKFIINDFTKGFKQFAFGLLDLNVMITKKYTHKRYIQEMQGIAKGAKMRKIQIQRLNIVPEIIKAACTVAGVWGAASQNGDTLQLRSLDWDASNPMSKYPLITVYQPSTKNYNKHANIGWVGMVGSLTGISEYLSIGQKVWLPPQGSVKMTRYGNPWTFVLRDVFYDSKNMSHALQILQNAHRTCAIHLGIGSKQDKNFRMLEYSQKILNNYDDTNYTNYDKSYHPKKAGIAYFDKYIQPSNDSCVGSILTNKQFYGKWNIQNLWRILGLSHQTGDTQLVTFNLQKQQIMVSYSRQYKLDNKIISEKAYQRAPFIIQMNRLWEDFS